MEKETFILEKMYGITHIPVRCFDNTGEIVIFRKGYESANDPIECDVDLRGKILAKLLQNTLPFIEYESDFYYGALKDLSGRNIIFGPVTGSKIDKAHLKYYAHRHKVCMDSFHITRKTVNEVSAALAMVYFIVNGKEVTEYEIMSNGCYMPTETGSKNNEYQNYMLEYVEVEREMPRYNFNDEMKGMQPILDGKPELIGTGMGMPSFSEENVGRLAKSTLKQHEYLTCSTIVLASRAAISGGLDPMTAYLMSDLYLQRLETCKEIHEYHKLIIDVSVDYAEMVKRKKEERSELSYVESSKNFIYKHLNKHFTVDDVANEVGVNKFYLMKRFSELEGMGIQQYAQLKRVEAAANMLKFSNEPISVIAEYMCFSSQSHFGKVFKKYKGLTPQSYRNKNKLIDFCI